MNRRMRMAVAVAAASATMALGGCAIITPTAPVRTPSALEACAHSTWSLDMAALQEQLMAYYAQYGMTPSLTIEGTQILDWTDDGHVTIDAAYTVRLENPSDVEGAPFAVVQTVNGEATGRAYFSDAIAIPRDWDASGIVIETTGFKGAEPLESPPYGVPRTMFDDTVGLEVVCSPESMTTHGRGTHLTLTWVPAA